MDAPSVEKNIQYTSFRYWRIIVPIMALIIIAEYVLLFFFYPASTNTARVVANLGLTKAVTNAVNAARTATTAVANTAAKATTAAANAAKVAANAAAKATK